MKKLRIFTTFFVLFCITFISTSSFAASEVQDGLEITLTSNQETYDKTENISAILTITNSNIFPVYNISLETTIPENYILENNSENAKLIEKLDIGETNTFEVTYSPKLSLAENQNVKNNSDTFFTHFENTGRYIPWIAVIIIVIAFVIITKKTKNKKKLILPLFLCIILTSILISSHVFANEKSNITLVHEVVVDEENIPISALISYDTITSDITNNELANDYETVTPLDTDNDGILDEDEIMLGLDPYSSMSNGITPDSERVFVQTLDTENIDDSLLENNSMIPSISGNVPDNINNHIFIEMDNIYALEDSTYAIGKQIYVNSDYSDTTSDLTLSFTSISTYKSLEYYIICQYIDGEIFPCDTIVNETTISTNVKRGSYFVIDTEEFLKHLGIPIEKYINTDATSSIVTEDYADISSKVGASIQMPQLDIVFVIDSTGSMSSEISDMVSNITTFTDKLTNQITFDINYALIDFKDITCGEETKIIKNGDSNWFTDSTTLKSAISSCSIGNGGDFKETAIDALATASTLDFRETSYKFAILVSDSSYKIDNYYSIETIDDLVEILNSKNIIPLIVSNSTYEPDYHDLYSNSHGFFYTLENGFITNFPQMVTDIAKIVGCDDTSYNTSVLLSDYQCIELKKPLDNSGFSSDKDSLSDMEELGTKVDQDIMPYIRKVLKINGIPEELYTGQTTISVYKYNSNPLLVDTDFDGINDDKDTKPNNNSFQGIMHYDSDSICNVDFTVDYRYFFYDNTKYIHNLSELAMLYSSDIYQDNFIEVTSGTTGGSDDAVTFGKLFGLSDCEDIVVSGYDTDEDDISEFFIGHRTVEYKDTTREIIILSVRGTNGTNAEWSSNFDVGADTEEYYSITGENHPDWKNKQNHKGFDVTTNRILEKYEEYLNKYGLNDSSTKSILITGHSRGAAIANLLGANFENDPNYMSYTYTFATPSTTLDKNADKYLTIMNIINTDDLIPCLPLWGFKKYGKIYGVSVAKDNLYLKSFNNLIGSYKHSLINDLTLKAFSEIASTREDLYKLDNSPDGKVNIESKYYVTKDIALNNITKLKEKLEKYKLARFCNFSVDYDSNKKAFFIETNYCPAYLMQNIANSAGRTNLPSGCPIAGFKTSGKYTKAKAYFIAAFLTGLTHPHMQPTYYIISNIL